MTSAYAMGRIQQWYQHGIRRDEAYRRGYDRATSLMLTMVADAKSSPRTAQPPAGRPSTAQPTTAQPSTAQPSTAQPSTAQPSTGQASTGRPPAAEAPRNEIPRKRSDHTVARAEAHRYASSPVGGGGRPNEKVPRHRRVAVGADSAGLDRHPAHRSH